MILDTQQKEKMEQLAHTIYGQALIGVLNKELEELNNVKTMNTIDELLGRKHAVKIIEELFSFMGEKKVGVQSKNKYL